MVLGPLPKRGFKNIWTFHIKNLYAFLSKMELFSRAEMIVEIAHDCWQAKCNFHNHFYRANAWHEYTLNTWRSIFEPSVKAHRVKVSSQKKYF